MGPSVGWIDVPANNILTVVAAGSYTVDASINLVVVNIAGAVTLVLPSAITPAAGAQAQPRLFAQNTITIVDIGGNAAAHPITINPASGAENIMGLASISLN